MVNKYRSEQMKKIPSNLTLGGLGDKKRKIFFGENRIEKILLK